MQPVAGSRNKLSSLNDIWWNQNQYLQLLYLNTINIWYYNFLTKVQASQAPQEKPSVPPIPSSYDLVSYATKKHDFYFLFFIWKLLSVCYYDKWSKCYCSEGLRWPHLSLFIPCKYFTSVASKNTFKNESSHAFRS